MERAARQWAVRQLECDPTIKRIGYIGSYARGDWGVGSDLDLIVIVGETKEPFLRRGLGLDATGLPVPADVMVYTVGEWSKMAGEGTRFYQTARDEAVWLAERGIA